MSALPGRLSLARVRTLFKTARRTKLPFMAKTAIVTGATGGIGQWIALGLARARFDLVLIARNPARAAATSAWLAQRVPGAEVEVEIADLSLLRDVRRAAASILARHAAIALLVNNAGRITRHRTLTAEGRETVIAVNLLAPFVLSGMLEPALRREAEAEGEARIVDVGSSASDAARLDPEDLERRRGWSIAGSYAGSKLALMMVAFERARRLAGSGVTVAVAHPGLVRTAIGDLPGPARLVWRAMTLLALTPEQGAEVPLHAALSPALRGITGRYYKRLGEATPNPLARDPVLAGRVWRAAEHLAGSPPAS